MTADEARQRFDFRWTVMGAAVTAAASIAFLWLSVAGFSFVGLSALGVLTSGFLARRLLTRANDATHFRMAQRLRLGVITACCVVALILFRGVSSVVMTVAAVLLWLVFVNAALQWAARYPIFSQRALVYVQFIGDVWVALFLMVWGVNWLVVAGVLAFASSTARNGGEPRDGRLLIVQVFSCAALLVIGSPLAIRAFSLYLFLVVTACAWSADHLVVLATDLRRITASASDGSTTR